MRIRTLFVFGTRPEAIKLCPVILHMKSRRNDFDVRVCVTAQHRGMLDQVLRVFNVTPDYDLDVMRPGQTLLQSTSRILAALEPVLKNEKADIILVQGDTTSTFCGALAAFYSGTPVGHIEAGLRTGDITEPFPEEMNRVLTGRIATYHFAATDRAAQNLLEEGVNPTNITVTGNTAVDAVLHVKAALDSGEVTGLSGFRRNPAKKLILVTAHRRENFGQGLEQICQSLLSLASRNDVEIVYPVHPNPNVFNVAKRYLGGQPNITLLDPLEYVPFVDLISHAYLLLTDSGGIQEEAPSLGKPVLVLRNKTERVEAVTAGTARLVGTDSKVIVREVEKLLDTPAEYDRMAHCHNPYGDGHSSELISRFLIGRLSRELVQTTA